MFGAEFGPAEVPVFASHGNRAQRSLEVICIHRHVGIAEGTLKTELAVADIEGLDPTVVSPCAIWWA